MKALYLIPGLFVVIGLAGIFLGRHKPALARRLLLGMIIGLWLCSTPVVATHWLGLFETEAALAPDHLEVPANSAIVILGSGRLRDSPEYGGDQPNGRALQRIRYGAFLHHRTGLPVLTTGGSLRGDRISEARIMATVLTEEFGLDEVWQEGKSRNTAENAAFSAPILQQHGIEHIYLVTHAWHMPRALHVFRQQGLAVTAAPTAFADRGMDYVARDFLPSMKVLQHSYYAMHETIGLLWYRLRY